jgi:DNA-binding NtrC family response regulator
LIVDDEHPVCFALERMLRRDYRQVFTAFGPDDAAAILEAHPVTHVVCDHWLGPGLPLGIDLIPRWRRRHRTIERAVVLTGADVSGINPPPEVDRVLSKTEDPTRLRLLLLREDP